VSAQRAGHVAALDGIRGVAVALVVVHHVVVRDRDPLIAGGWLGVDLFFVLSGFLITGSVLQRADVGDFFRRRFWRLAPAMAVFLAVYVAWSAGAGDVAQRMKWAGAAATQWANVQGAIGPPFSPHIGHLWSLSAEVQFYVVWGLVLAYLVRRGTSRSLIAGLLVVLFAASWIERAALWEGGTPWNRLYLGPDTHSASLLAGCMVGIAFDAGWLRAPRVLAALSIPAAALLAWQVVELSFLDARTYLWGLTATAACGVVLVASVAVRAPSPLRPVFELPPLVWLGQVSYSVYLWHLPIIHEVARRRPDDPVGVALVAVPLTLVVASLSYAIVERPLLSSTGRARLRARLA
jgi:peptidoglycan/LPS O-acetylase OafA/YrhL